jgi:hypothetical protein
MDPLLYEARSTVFDFMFFINNLIEEINAENKEREKNNRSNDRLVKLLRAMKYTLNNYDL